MQQVGLIQYISITCASHDIVGQHDTTDFISGNVSTTNANCFVYHGSQSYFLFSIHITVQYSKSTLGFNVPLDTLSVVSETIFPANQSTGAN